MKSRICSNIRIHRTLLPVRGIVGPLFPRLIEPRRRSLKSAFEPVNFRWKSLLEKSQRKSLRFTYYEMYIYCEYQNSREKYFDIIFHQITSQKWKHASYVFFKLSNDLTTNSNSKKYFYKTDNKNISFSKYFLIAYTCHWNSKPKPWKNVSFN